MGCMMSEWKHRQDIKDKASYLVADMLSDGIVEHDDEVEFLLAVIECATFSISENLERDNDE